MVIEFLCVPLPWRFAVGVCVCVCARPLACWGLCSGSQEPPSTVPNGTMSKDFRAARKHPANLTWLTLHHLSPISPLRMNPCMVVFHGDLMMLGGLCASGRPLDDVWRSKDALTWTNVH
eukprot:RCo018228